MWVATAVGIVIVAVGAYLRGYCDARAENAGMWKQVQEELRDF